MRAYGIVGGSLIASELRVAGANWCTEVTSAKLPQNFRKTILEIAFSSCFLAMDVWACNSSPVTLKA
jgi:hypothetical protein